MNKLKRKCVDQASTRIEVASNCNCIQVTENKLSLLPLIYISLIL